MTLQQSIVCYFAITLFFLIVDAIWLKFVAHDFFNENIGHLMKENVSLSVAAGFYAVYTIGIIIFAISPARADFSYQTAFLYGALFGFFCYAAYDLTNLATLKGWPIKVVIVDIAWGAILTGLSAVVGIKALKTLQNFS